MYIYIYLSLSLYLFPPALSLTSLHFFPVIVSVAAMVLSPSFWVSLPLVSTTYTDIPLSLHLSLSLGLSFIFISLSWLCSLCSLCLLSPSLVLPVFGLLARSLVLSHSLTLCHCHCLPLILPLSLFFSHKLPRIFLEGDREGVFVFGFDVLCSMLVEHECVSVSVSDEVPALGRFGGKLGHPAHGGLRLKGSDSETVWWQNSANCSKHINDHIRTWQPWKLDILKD